MRTSLEMADWSSRVAINVLDTMQEYSRERLQSALRPPYILLQKVWILNASAVLACGEHDRARRPDVALSI